LDRREILAPTIKEIAKKAGVSYSTVSRALNNKKGVRLDIRDRVLKIAAEMDYAPHASARALVQKKVGVIGVVIPRTSEFAFQNPYFSHMLLGLGAVANQHGYNLMLNINEKKSYASLYHRRLVDGVVVVANRMDDERLFELAQKDVPAVAIPGFPPEADVDIASVNSENSKCVRRAVNYLIELGHRDIAFILGQRNSKYTVERSEAFKAAFKQNGIECKEKYLVESDFSKTDAFRLMGQLLDMPDPPSAVLCINDSVTPGALHQINSRGLRIPEDISVVAIGCSDTLELFEPPLTTIHVPVIQLGKTAANLIIELIETGHCDQKNVIIPTDLVIRESTGPYKGII
jgi:LacI family transcriptional regulator